MRSACCLQLISLSLLTLLTARVAVGLECPAMPQQTHADWDGEVRASVARLGKLLGPEVETHVRSATVDLLGRLPGADRVYLEQMLFASYCSALRDDPGLREEERAKRVAAYRKGLAALRGEDAA